MGRKTDDGMQIKTKIRGIQKSNVLEGVDSFFSLNPTLEVSRVAGGEI